MVLHNYNSLHWRSFAFTTLLIASKCRLFVGTAAHLANPIILMVDSVPWYEKYCLWGSDQNQWGSMTCACNNKDLIPPNNDVKVCKKTWVRSVQSELSTAWFISWAGEFDKLQCCNCGGDGVPDCRGGADGAATRPQPLFMSILLKMLHRHNLQVAHSQLKLHQF